MSHIYIYGRFVVIDNNGEFTIRRYPTQERILNEIDKLMGVFPIMILRSIA